ncbi:MAG TPA: hypothetical protein VGD25_09710 [Immundisolibacter sp.]
MHPIIQVITLSLEKMRLLIAVPPALPACTDCPLQPDADYGQRGFSDGDSSMTAP